MQIRNISTYVLLIACMPFIASCGNEVLTFKAASATLAATSYGVFSDPKVNLKEKNYAAADFLQSQIKKHVSAHNILVAMPLDEVDQPGITSPFGSYVSEGIGLRLQELGYQVLLHNVTPYGNQSLYPKPKVMPQADFVLRGSYAVKVKTVDVYLRVVDTSSQNIVGQFDYTMPLSREIKKMSENEPEIFRVKK
ncbi:MAG: hypothetical protein ACTHOO_04140 [Alcanivorax sp.]